MNYISWFYNNKANVYFRDILYVIKFRNLNPAGATASLNQPDVH